MMDWINVIAKVLIPLIGAVLLHIVYPYIKSQTTKEQRANIVEWVRIAVASAEQMQDAGLIAIPKKEFVIKFIRDKGLDITDEDLDVLIEALVKELNLEQELGMMYLI